MSRKRIVYQDWIVELGRDPDQQITAEDQQGFISINDKDPDTLSSENVRDHEAEKKSRKETELAVEEALSTLEENEREFIRQFYFMGQSYKEISEKSGRATYRLEAIHRRAVRKLRKALVPFVREKFNLRNSQTETGSAACPICQSVHRNEIDAVISGRDKKKSWRPVIRLLREEYNIAIKSPQILIGHEKYH